MLSPGANIRELKARLSYYLRLTKAGQVVEIKERGKLIGRIVPASLSLEERIEAIARSGLVRWNQKKLPRRSPVARAKGNKTVSELLIEGRE